MAITGDEDDGLSTPIQSYIKYFNRIKPYHTKILEVLEQYNLSDTVVPSFFENMEILVQLVTPTVTLTVSPTITPSNTATPSFTPTNTVTNTPTATPGGTPAPTATSGVTPTPTQTENATPTPTATVTVTPTNTVTPTVTVSPSPTMGASATATPTPSPTVTVTPTSGGTATPTPTATATVTPTNTATNTPTPTVTPTLTVTPSATPGTVKLQNLFRGIDLPADLSATTFEFRFQSDGRLGEIFDNPPSSGALHYEYSDNWFTTAPLTGIGSDYEVRLIGESYSDVTLTRIVGAEPLVYVSMASDAIWKFQGIKPLSGVFGTINLIYDIRDVATFTQQAVLEISITFLDA